MTRQQDPLPPNRIDPQSPPEVPPAPPPADDPFEPPEVEPPQPNIDDPDHGLPEILPGQEQAPGT
ncbi:MAG TPA: hypothetical protein VF440_07175 [Novosphingobium sp.]